MENTLDPQVQRLFDRLKAMASQLLSHEQSAQTLQTTLVMHDALDKISKKQMPDGDFLVLASQAMRQVVIDHIREKFAIKRGGPGRAKSAAEEDIALPRSVEPGSRDVYDPSDPSMEAFLAYDSSQSTRERVRKENRSSYIEFIIRRRTEAGPSERSITDEQTGLLHDGIRELYQDDQLAAQAIDMVHFGEMSFQEIATAIGSSKSTVSDRYHRGLKKLRGYLDGPAGTNVAAAL